MLRQVLPCVAAAAAWIAKWHIFKPKILILVNFGETCNGSGCHLVYFTAIWYILWLVGIFFHILICSHNDKSGNPGCCTVPWPAVTLSFPNKVNNYTQALSCAQTCRRLLNSPTVGVRGCQMAYLQTKKTIWDNFREPCK
jgi:hypothetical protein